MKKAKNRTASTVATMLVIALAILSFYFYWSYRTKPLEETSPENMTEIQKLLNKDLDQNYPETAREVTKLFGNMMKNLYDNNSDEEIEALALKIRELYDEEFLVANPEDSYLQNLYSDIASWKEANRRISNYNLVDSDMVEEQELEGVKYTVIYLAFTIQENGKFTETWKMMLRQDKEKKWKILGWQVVPSDTQTN